jgi:hypothetical protein
MVAFEDGEWVTSTGAIGFTRTNSTKHGTSPNKLTVASAKIRVSSSIL